MLRQNKYSVKRDDQNVTNQPFL